MIMTLIMKDFRICGSKVFLRLTPLAIIAGTLFIFRYYNWSTYMMYGYLFITTAILLLLLIEKRGLSELSICCLPVSRLQIVTARFLSVGLMTVLLLAFWYLAGVAASILFPNAPSDFSYALNIKSVFISSVYFAILISILLPAVFGFSTTGVILTFVPALIGAIMSVPLLFYPYKISYRPFFEASDYPLYMLIAAVMTLFLLLSFLLSVQIYRNKNL
jgi:hypothetical protein